jgi:hypothetical protein
MGKESMIDERMSKSGFPSPFEDNSRALAARIVSINYQAWRNMRDHAREYSELLRRWDALPWWKRWRTSRPTFYPAVSDLEYLEGQWQRDIYEAVKGFLGAQDTLIEGLYELHREIVNTETRSIISRDTIG